MQQNKSDFKCCTCNKTSLTYNVSLKFLKKLFNISFPLEASCLEGNLFQIKYKDSIFCHLKYKFMPYTNNTLENLIKQYERRLKTIEGFGNNRKIIKGYLNLMAISYCFKPHTDCRDANKYKNGKLPLEVAGISTKSLDWVRFSLNNRLS